MLACFLVSCAPSERGVEAEEVGVLALDSSLLPGGVGDAKTNSLLKSFGDGA